MRRLAPMSQCALLHWQQSSRISRTSNIPQLQVHTNTMKSSGAMTIKSQTGANKNVLNYWKSITLVAGACGALGLLDEQNAVACAASKGIDEDPLKQVKKKVQELSTAAIAQFASLLPKECNNLQKKVDEFRGSGKGGQISWGFCMGACAGFALKKVSKLGAVTVGTLFIMLQCASYLGYVDVDYKKLKWDFKNYLDIDQDAVLDTKNLDSMYKSVRKMLECSLPANSGFAAGFVLGFRLA